MEMATQGSVNVNGVRRPETEDTLMLLPTQSTTSSVPTPNQIANFIRAETERTFAGFEKLGFSKFAGPHVLVSQLLPPVVTSIIGGQVSAGRVSLHHVER